MEIYFLDVVQFGWCTVGTWTKDKNMEFPAQKSDRYRYAEQAAGINRKLACQCGTEYSKIYVVLKAEKELPD